MKYLFLIMLPCDPEEAAFSIFIPRTFIELKKRKPNIKQNFWTLIGHFIPQSSDIKKDCIVAIEVV